MVDAVTLYPAAASEVAVGGQPVVAAFGGVLGGLLVNPAHPEDQGLPEVETLFYDLTGPAAATQTATTFPLLPGQSLTIPPGTTSDVSVNAASSGHRFSGYIIQRKPEAVPLPGSYPPSGPTSLTKIIPMVLYEQYQDDDDLQAFVAAHNRLAQQYLDFFNSIQLPIYTNPLIAGALLDWVAENLYGMRRPVMFSGSHVGLGGYNTVELNFLAYNEKATTGVNRVDTADDDIFKRVMTWNLYRGDGTTFNVMWLKRRIKRFLIGEYGAAPPIDNTYEVSVTYGSRGVLNIKLPNVDMAQILQEAIESGAVQLPFQYTYNVTIAS